mgnify:CR=1 FL=1
MRKWTCVTGICDTQMLFKPRFKIYSTEKGLAEIVIHDLRTFGLGNYKQIDDSQFGGGAGMVLMIEPISKCIDALKVERVYDEIIYMFIRSCLYFISYTQLNGR